MADPEPIRVDNSLLSDMVCSTRGVLRHVLGYTTVDDSAALLAGTAVHEALAVRFKGGTRKEALRAFRKVYKAWAEEHIDPEDRNMGRLSYDNVRLILTYWLRKHPLSKLPFVVEPEGVEIPFELELAPGIIATGRMDLAPVKDRHDRSIISVLDHKTTGYASPVMLHNLKVGSQGSHYTWAAQEVIPEPVSGIMFNVIQLSQLPGMKDPDRKCGTHKVPYVECQPQHVTFHLVTADRNARQIAEWKGAAIMLAKRYWKYKTEITDISQIRQVPKEGEFFGQCGWCPFKHFCLSGRKPSLVKSMLKHQPWTPWDKNKEEKAA